MVYLSFQVLIRLFSIGRKDGPASFFQLMNSICMNESIKVRYITLSKFYSGFLWYLVIPNLSLLQQKHLICLAGFLIISKKKSEIVIGSCSYNELISSQVNTQEKFKNVKVDSENTKLLLLRELNEPAIGDQVLPIDQPPVPVVILVGPPACQKGSIVRELCKKNEKQVNMKT